MTDDRYTEIEDCEVLQTTDAAILVEYEQDQEWLPRSCVMDGYAIKKGTHEELSVKTWKLEEVNWI